LAREAHRLLQIHGRSKSLRRQVQFSQKLERWTALYLKSKGIFGNLADGLPNPALTAASPLSDHPEVLDRLGRTAVLLQIDEELRNGNYKKVQKLADAWRPYISNDDDKVSLMAAKAVAWEREGAFGKAMGAYEALEEVGSAAKRAYNGNAPNYSTIKAELADSMAARGQVKGELPAVAQAQERTLPEDIPDTYAMHPPYPNPFSSSMKIPVDMPEPGNLKIVVYDMLGRRVITIMDQEYPAGSHDIPMDASALSSGVYMIDTRWEEQQANRMVTLIK